MLHAVKKTKVDTVWQAVTEIAVLLMTSVMKWQTWNFTTL